MAVEVKRGCGYRKVGGLYMVGGGIGVPCDRLPFELSVCSCCGQGIKQALGWTWIDVAKFFNGAHENCVERCTTVCPLCDTPETLGRAGLIWVGEKFYKTPDDFVKEGVSLGFSRRIKAVPHGFKVGETYIMLAHSKAVKSTEPITDVVPVKPDGQLWAGDEQIYFPRKPGIFYAWLPQRLEKIMKESARGTEEVADLEKRGISPVFVPDDDPDHQGNVHTDHALAKRKKREADLESYD